MLSTMRSSWLLFALFALFALSSALNIGDLNLDGIEEYLNHGVKRQAQGTGNSQSSQPPATSQAPPPATSAAPTTRPPQTTAAPDPSQSNAPSSAAPSSNNNPAPSSQGPATSSAAEPSDSNQPTRASSSEITAPVTESTPLVTRSTRPVVVTITTKINGQDTVQTSSSEEVITQTTGMTLNTRLPNTQNSGGSSSGGLSSQKKAIIGGVVGGVGGALLLGGVALVCWRMWGKKKNRVTEDDADLMAGTGSALGDKPNQSATPFQSNLEQYHNPGGRPNAAANF